jgi:hypothetical protein
VGRIYLILKGEKNDVVCINDGVASSSAERNIIGKIEKPQGVRVHIGMPNSKLFKFLISCSQEMAKHVNSLYQ